MGLNKNKVDPSNNPVDDSSNPATPATTDTPATPATTATTATPAAPAPSACNCQAGAVAAAAGADQVAKAVSQPVKRITKDVSEAITDIGSNVGKGMVKIGSQMLGALPFVGAIFDLGNAANSFTEMIKKSVKPAKKIADSMSKASTDIQKNIDNAEKTPPDVTAVSDTAKPAKLTMRQRLSNMGSSVKNKTKKLFGFKGKEEAATSETAAAATSETPAATETTTPAAASTTGGGSYTLQTGGKILRRVDESFKQFENPLSYYNKNINIHKTRRHFHNRHNVTRKH